MVGLGWEDDKVFSEAVDEWIQQLKLSMNMSVKEIALISNGFAEVKLLAGKKKAIARSIATFISSEKTHDISSAHSFLNNMNQKDWTVANRAVEHLEQVIEWITNHTELRNFVQRGIKGGIYSPFEYITHNRRFPLLSYCPQGIYRVVTVGHDTNYDSAL